MTGQARAALVAVLCGQLATGAAEVLPLAVLLPALLLTCGAAAWSARAGEAVSRRLRTGATAVCAVLALVLLPQALSGGGGSGVLGVLGPLLVGVSVAQALTWSTRRDVRTGVLVAFGLLVLGASFAPDVLVGLPILVGWWAVVTAGVLGHRQGETDGADVVLPEPGRSRSAAAVAVGVAAVLGLVGFLLLPVEKDEALRDRLAAARAAASGARSAPGAYIGDRVDLRIRGKLTDQRLVEVPADSPPLWRAGVYVDWDGTTWTAPRAQRVDGPTVVVAETDRPTRTDEVRVERAAGAAVWSPGPIASVELRGRAARLDELGAMEGPTFPAYRVTTEVVQPSAEQLAAATGEDPGDPRWTSLPDSVPERVLALGRELTTGAPTRADAVERVRAHLRGRATYDLESPVPGPGEDAVDRFLFVDRVGFCEQFAAAQVLLLRAAGIPARFVTGLGYGRETAGGRREFQQRDLHAWTEVFHPGLGWVASDPTPPSVQTSAAPLRDRVVAAVTSALERADDVPGGRRALAAALVLAALATALVRQAVRRRRPADLGPGAPSAVPPPGVLSRRPALAAFLRFDARLGSSRRRAPESLAELRRRLGAGPELDRAIEAVERECYAPEPPVEVDEAVRVLDRSPR